MSLPELLAAGEKMGLKDKALQDFVHQQQEYQREERQREREVHKLADAPPREGERASGGSN